jgi:CheY-like chemotaxis protein
LDKSNNHGIYSYLVLSGGYKTCSGGAMQHFSIPTCYFPSTVLFVDDKRDFLANFVVQMDENLAYRVFYSPFAALECIHKKRCELDLLSQRCLSEYTEAKNCPLTNHTINLDLAAIHAEIYNPHRFTEISVVVVDYAMPGMNGLEFCRCLEETKIKRILLTDKADEKIAIKAFNEGLIHRYFQKNDPKVVELISQSIHDLQLQYFQTMLGMIGRILSVTAPNCLHDKKFTKFFHELLHEKGIVEHYLADNSGSFLLLDNDANASFLIVKNETDMHLYYDLALDNGASDEVLDQLSGGEKIPCFWQANNQPLDWNDWSTCLVPAQRFVSDNTYFYAYVQEPALFHVQRDKILSYRHYLG